MSVQTCRVLKTKSTKELLKPIDIYGVYKYICSVCTHWCNILVPILKRENLSWSLFDVDFLGGF